MDVGALVVVPEQVAEDAVEEESCVYRLTVLHGRKGQDTPLSDLAVTKNSPQLYTVISLLN